MKSLECYLDNMHYDLVRLEIIQLNSVFWK